MAQSCFNLEQEACSLYYKVDSNMMKDLVAATMYTPVFEFAGKKWALWLSRQGSKMDLKLFYQASAMMNATFDLGLVSKNGTPSSKYWMRSSCIFSSKNQYSQTLTFTWEELNSHYIRDGYFLIFCAITTNEGFIPSVNSSLSKGFPVNIVQELSLLLERNDLMDVTLEVDGEQIQAHKAILAARSPVFRSELLSPTMNPNIIKISDMKAHVLKGIVHFIYTDSLPMEGFIPDNTTETEYYQLLLVASEKYGLPGLINLCEGQLMRSISLESVISSLILAENNEYIRLKELCLVFMAQQRNLLQLITTEEYFNMGKDYPSLATDLRKLLNIEY
ncbi:BTB/POZ and MATH domain-containing protein 2 [Rhynchospora pubera]|uniref:BTB/POZ and MATH domain-containing protein 2 n=1 Tax=Rhynchospora pubera TaxID=906938 RepID=A0AAV8FEL7_9POAL|nr:BTB/POZ and MATH domain-containing protein 2 [Rhynchospora pubera]